MAIDSTGKVAYLYKDGTWYAISGAINTNAAYDWTASQTFSADVTFESVVKAQGGINNFADTTARDAAIPSPTNGVVAFLRSINQLQYYYNGSWVNVLDEHVSEYHDKAQVSTVLADYTVSLSDVGKTLNVSSSDPIVITIPPNSSEAFATNTVLSVIRTGTGSVTIAAGSGVTINSKNSNKKIAAQYSGATICKLDTNTWILIGDLTA